MTLRRIDLRGDPDPELDPVLTHLSADLPLAYPTETVYGLGGSVTPEGVRRVRRLKQRGVERPLLVLLEGPSGADALRWTEAAHELARAFWPGALTLVLDDPERIFPPGVRSEAGSVGVRVSPYPLVRRLLAAYGRPLTSTSLNEPGNPPARSGTEAADVALRLGGGRQILLLDAGTLPPSEASTVVDCTGSVPHVLREGSIPVERLRCVIPEIHERRQI